MAVIKGSAVLSGHTCDPYGAPVAALDIPGWVLPGKVVALGCFAEYARVRLVWRCCGTAVVERLMWTDDPSTYSVRYLFDDLRKPDHGEVYSVPCAGAAWSLYDTCGCVQGEDCTHV